MCLRFENDNGRLLCSFFFKINESCHRGFQPSPTQKGPTAAEDE